MKFSFILLVTFLFVACTNTFDGKNGTRIAYFKNTKKISQSVEYKNGHINGLWKEFYETGTLKFCKHYVNDTLQDSSIFYHKNGQISVVEIFRKGKKHGCWKKFNENGKMYGETNFKENSLDGRCNTYTYYSGRPLKLLNYKNNLKDGVQKVFYDNGEQKSISYYSEGKPCKGLEEWTESGKKIINDFKITVVEQNKLLLENKIVFHVKLEDSKPDDKVCEISENGDCPEQYMYLTKKDNLFEAEYILYKGDFVMKQVTIAAYRKTTMGNTMIKTTSFNVSATNF